MKKIKKYKLFNRELIKQLSKVTPRELQSQRLMQLDLAFEFINEDEKLFWLGYESLSWKEGEVRITMMRYTNHLVFSACFVDKSNELRTEVINLTSQCKSTYQSWLMSMQNY